MSAPINYTIKQATIGLERIQLQFSRSWEAGAAVAGQEAIKLLQARVIELEAAQFPIESTPEIQEILSMMMWHTGPIAHTFRAAGRDIARKGEAEQAFVMHWLIHLALKHGAGWRKAAGDELTVIYAAIKANEK